MHILFLVDNFPPEVNAPATRTYEHCLEWIKAGHKVTVITCAPRSEEHRSEIKSTCNHVCRLWLDKTKYISSLTTDRQKLTDTLRCTT